MSSTNPVMGGSVEHHTVSMCMACVTSGSCLEWGAQRVFVFLLELGANGLGSSPPVQNGHRTLRNKPPLLYTSRTTEHPLTFAPMTAISAVGQA